MIEGATRKAHIIAVLTEGWKFAPMVSVRLFVCILR